MVKPRGRDICIIKWRCHVMGSILLVAAHSKHAQHDIRLDKWDWWISRYTCHGTSLLSNGRSPIMAYSGNTNRIYRQCNCPWFSLVALFVIGQGKPLPSSIKVGVLIGVALVLIAQIIRLQLPASQGGSYLLWWQVVMSMLLPCIVAMKGYKKPPSAILVP